MLFIELPSAHQSTHLLLPAHLPPASLPATYRRTYSLTANLLLSGRLASVLVSWSYRCTCCFLSLPAALPLYLLPYRFTCCLAALPAALPLYLLPCRSTCCLSSYMLFVHKCIFRRFLCLPLFVSYLLLVELPASCWTTCFLLIYLLLVQIPAAFPSSSYLYIKHSTMTIL